jgi:hypothetical protein
MKAVPAAMAALYRSRFGSPAIALVPMKTPAGRRPTAAPITPPHTAPWTAGRTPKSGRFSSALTEQLLGVQEGFEPQDDGHVGKLPPPQAAAGRKTERTITAPTATAMPAMASAAPTSTAVATPATARMPSSLLASSPALRLTTIPEATPTRYGARVRTNAT